MATELAVALDDAAVLAFFFFGSAGVGTATMPLPTKPGVWKSGIVGIRMEAGTSVIAPSRTSGGGLSSGPSAPRISVAVALAAAGPAKPRAVSRSVDPAAAPPVAPSAPQDFSMLAAAAAMPSTSALEGKPSAGSKDVEASCATTEGWPVPTGDRSKRSGRSPSTTFMPVPFFNPSSLRLACSSCQAFLMACNPLVALLSADSWAGCPGRLSKCFHTSKKKASLKRPIAAAGGCSGRVPTGEAPQPRGSSA
mmetsp:Transcript_58254/g.177560  ORF Transcript_58254/g.177560 Transcript_58254/m.177560 type:complete len:251 (+) Transcript_58254:889-1641(+)